MNEITFRTKLLTNPHQLDEDMLAFLEANPDKKSTVQKAREFDQQIIKTLDVEIPEGLHARILLNQSYQQNTSADEAIVYLGTSSTAVEKTEEPKLETLNTTTHKADNKLKSWLTPFFINWPAALAASVVAFALFFTVLQTNHSTKAISGEAMVEHILAHISEDPTLMTEVKLPTTKAQMQQLFASVGAQINKPVEGMSYAGICDVEGQKGLHIVMQENGQPITIIVMPGQKLAAMKAFQKSGYHGELLPVKGGIVAIVANSMEQVALAQTRFFKAVKFA